MKKLLLLVAVSGLLMADCSSTIVAAYQAGSSNRGGAMNQEHAEKICENNINARGLPVNDATMDACLAGINPNYFNGVAPIVNQYCR